MIPAVIGIGLVACLIMRRWILAAFVVFVVAVESATYRATSLIVERQRPEVERLESLPSTRATRPGILPLQSPCTAGFSSCWHRDSTVSSSVSSRSFSASVSRCSSGWSRMYRGMHHFSDVVAGLLMGLGALVILVFAARAARASTDRRDGVGLAADAGTP